MSDEAIQRVLVTGANKGIGRATVEAILDHSENTFVYLGSRSKERGEAARAEIVAERPGAAERVQVLEIDVGDEASVKAAAAGIDGELYGIVNTAGIGRQGRSMAEVINVNARGPRRVCEAFLPQLAEDGRVVNVSSASGPSFVATCSAERQRTLTRAEARWAEVEALIAEAIAIEDAGGDFRSAGLGEGDAYGLSKACLNAFTIELAREQPGRVVNACTPGFIETDMTRPYADARGVSPEEMGMKRPREGTRATMHLLFGDVEGRGHYFGSDARRSPLDRYRSPGDPPYTGD